MQDALAGLIAVCHGDGPATGCPILEALNNPEDAAGDYPPSEE